MKYICVVYQINLIYYFSVYDYNYISLHILSIYETILFYIHSANSFITQLDNQ